MYDLLIIYLTNECNTHIPEKRTHPKNTNHIWIDENLKQLVRQKKNLRYTNCASGWKNPDMIRKYNEVCKITTAKIKLARKEFEKELITKSKRHPKILYNYVNRQKNKSNTCVKKP
jgi:hypothetical protein